MILCLLVSAPNLKILFGCRALYGVVSLHEFMCFYAAGFSVARDRLGGVQGDLFLAQFLRACFPCCLKSREFFYLEGPFTGPDFIKEESKALRDEAACLSQSTCGSRRQVT